jgi:hypothetical protein
MLIELDDNIMSAAADVHKIVAQKPTEIERNSAMEDGLNFQESIDRLLTSAHKRRNDAVHLLDMYRHGLGQHWQEISCATARSLSIGAWPIFSPSCNSSAPGPPGRDRLSSVSASSAARGRRQGRSVSRWATPEPESRPSPVRFATLMPQALSADHLATRVSITLAAS